MLWCLAIHLSPLFPFLFNLLLPFDLNNLIIAYVSHSRVMTVKIVKAITISNLKYQFKDSLSESQMILHQINTDNYQQQKSNLILNKLTKIKLKIQISQNLLYKNCSQK